MGATQLSPSVVQDLCRQYSHLRVENAFQILSYTLKESSGITSGFLGRHESLHVKIQNLSSNEKQELIFFIKSAPSDIASRAEYIEQFGVFKKEICVYRDLLPRLKYGFTDIAPACYYAKDNILVFEHLGELGFRMGADRSGILDFNHLNCALKSLANLHAASIVFEATNKQSIPEIFPEAVRENSYPEGDTNVRLLNFNNANIFACELIKLMPRYKDCDQLKYIVSEFPLTMRKIFELCKPSTKYCNVVSHGDLWANNLLFKYENGFPVECRLVDFQLTRYAPPILDVITLLTISTARAFRSKHLDTFLGNYYGMLKELLEQKSLSIDHYIPRKEFDESVAEFKLCGLIESFLFSHMTILPDELTANLTTDTEGFEDFFSRKRSEICMKAFNTDDLYRRRLTDMVSDIIDNYILLN